MAIDKQVKIWLDQKLNFLLHDWLTRVSVKIKSILRVLLNHGYVDRVPDFDTAFLIELLILMINSGWDILW